MATGQDVTHNTYINGALFQTHYPIILVYPPNIFKMETNSTKNDRLAYRKKIRKDQAI